MTAWSLARCYVFRRAKTKTWHVKMSARSFYQTRSQHYHSLVPSSGKSRTSKGPNATAALQTEIPKEKGAPRYQNSRPRTQYTLLYLLSAFQRKGSFNTPNLHYYSPHLPTLESRTLRILYQTSPFCSEGMKQETSPFQMKSVFNFLFTAAVANKFL